VAVMADSTLCPLALGALDEDQTKNVIETFESFRGWYLTGISADMGAGIVELALMFDDRSKRVRVLFKGASRCLVNGFLIQNIIYEMK
jgi:hypothetical protein